MPSMSGRELPQTNAEKSHLRVRTCPAIPRHHRRRRRAEAGIAFLKTLYSGAAGTKSSRSAGRDRTGSKSSRAG